jgi:Fic family protein
LDFFAEAVITTADQALDTTRHLTDLSKVDRDKISGLGRAAVSTFQVHRALLERPIATAGWLVKKTTISPATINKCLNHLENLDIVRELTGRKRNRLYSYSRYIEIMNYGTGLPDERNQNNL